MLSGEKARRGRKPKQAPLCKDSDDQFKLEEVELHCPEKAVEVVLLKEEAPRTETAEQGEQQSKRQAKNKKIKRVAKETITLTQSEPMQRSEQADPPKVTAPVADDQKPCTCKNGRCAKKYCVCLKRGSKCNPAFCTCRDCENLDSPEAEARRLEQLQKLEDGLLIRKGCNCKRNRCEQNYCICFQQGLDCDPKLCECQDCKNVEHLNKERKEQPLKAKMSVDL